MGIAALLLALLLARRHQGYLTLAGPEPAEDDHAVARSDLGVKKPGCASLANQ
jgi:hypothetical protein